MLHTEVLSIRDLIYYQYAKLVCRSTFHIPDGVSAIEKHYSFIKNTFRELKNGYKQWSDIVREDLKLFESEKKCIYCSTSQNISQEHIVPRSLKILPRCGHCDTVQGAHNLIWTCRECSSAKGLKGLYEFYKDKYPDDNKFYDHIPALAEKQYLRTMYCCHGCAGTLDKCDIDEDGKIDVYEIDFILHQL
jgi:hypothetical protein